MIKKFLFSITLLVASASLIQAQGLKKEVVMKIPELEVNKVYDGKEIRKAKSNFPDGFYITKYRLNKYYPFAKISNKKLAVIFLFKEEGKSRINLEAYTFNFKTEEFARVSGVAGKLYDDGKFSDEDMSKGLLKTNANQEVFVQITRNNKPNPETGKYQLTKKEFVFVDWLSNYDW